MVKFLVENLQAHIGQLGHLEWKGLEVPPLFATIIYDSSSNQDIIKYLMRKDAANESSVVLNSIKSSSIPLQEKIEILKFVGAAYILVVEDVIFGKKCWLDAMTLRIQSNTLIPDVPRQLSEMGRKVFENAKEFTTTEELEVVCIDNHSYHVRSQALLIIERIGSQVHLGPHPFFIFQLLEYHHLLIPLKDPSFCFNILILVLQGLRDTVEWEVVINSEWLNDIVEEISLNVLMAIVNSRDLPENNAGKLKFSQFLEVFRGFSYVHLKLLKNREVARASKLAADIVERLIYFFKDMPLFNPVETKVFEQWLSHYIKKSNKYSGVFTPLHAACKFRPQVKFIRLLLACGAYQSATDERGWSPMHFLFRSCYDAEIFTSVQSLLNAGAHIDQINADGHSSLDFFKWRKLQLDQEGRPDPNLDTLVNSLLPFSLQCFSDKVICLNKIKFDNKLPPDLRTFVKRHGAEM